MCAVSCLPDSALIPDIGNVDVVIIRVVVVVGFCVVVGPLDDPWLQFSRHFEFKAWVRVKVKAGVMDALRDAFLGCDGKGTG